MKITKKEPEDLLKEAKSWWQLRAWIIALDRDEQIGPTALTERIWLRRN